MLSRGSFQHGSRHSPLPWRWVAPASFLTMFLTGACAGGSSETPAGGSASGNSSSAAAGSSQTAGGSGNDTAAGGQISQPDPTATGGEEAVAGSSVGGAVAGSGNVANGGASGGPSGGAPPVSSGGTTIVNDTFWKDTAGKNIYSQGGGALLVGDTYYWYGVSYGNDASYAGGTPSSQGVTTYSSKDLVNWKSESLSMPSNAGGWFGRLGVVYHAATKKYVLVAQGGGGLYFATSDVPGGPFVYNNVQNNLPGIANGGTGDQTMFQDDDGSAYLVASSKNGRSNRYLSPLRAADFLAVEQAIPVYSGGGREGNCMFKYMGTYYYCSSDLHGWNASPAYCVSATNIKGPWSAEFVLDGTQSDFSHVTQTGFFISVKGSQATTIIFAGDRWANNASNGIGFNQWMPISFDGKTPHFHSLSKWTIDAAAGTWAVARGNNYVLNPSFEADRVDTSAPAGWKATNGHNILSAFHTGRWSWQLSASGTLEQQATAVPDGTYTLSAWAKGGAGQLMAKGCGGPDSTTPIPASNDYASVKSSPITVSGGKCTVSVSASAQMTLDDLVLADQ